MTSADLVSLDADDKDVKSGSVVSPAERCCASGTTSLEAVGRSVTSGETTQVFDIRTFTSAISSAKSNSEIEKIVRKFSQTLSNRSSSSKCETASDSGRDTPESRQSVPETGGHAALDSSGSTTVNGSLTASTKSYSWSSSLPNGSRLETLTSSTADDQPDAGSTPSAQETGGAGNGGDVSEDVPAGSKRDNVADSSAHVGTASGAELGSNRADVVTTVASGNQSRVSFVRAVGDGDAMASRTTQPTPGGIKHGGLKKLRVGDMLPTAHDDASQATFSSPRASLVARLSRPHHLDDQSVDQSRLDRSSNVAMSFQHGNPGPRGHPSAPTSAANFSGVGSPSSVVRSLVSGGDRVDRMASFHWLMSDLSSADVGSLHLAGSRHLEVTANVLGLADNTSWMSTGVIEDTVTNSSPLMSLAYQSISDTSSAADLSSTVDHIVNGAGLTTFAGIFPVSTQSSSPNMSAPSISGMSLIIWLDNTYLIKN